MSKTIHRFSPSVYLTVISILLPKECPKDSVGGYPMFPEVHNKQSRKWYVLYTKPRYEKKTHTLLQAEIIESFFPMREEIHQWSDRKKHVEVPLFSNYIFVYVNEKERIRALDIDGAMKYVHFGGKIATVRQETIDSLRIALTRKEDIRLEDTYLDIGQVVKVVRGPLQGMRGILLQRRGPTRVAIQVDAIKQMVSVEVPVGDLVLL